MKEIKIMPEYGCSPLWLYEGYNAAKSIEIKEVNISEGLKSKIQNWADIYESTFNEDYPPDSMFSNSDDEKSFEVEGLEIWKQLQKEIGNEYVIRYFSILNNKVYENISLYNKRK